METNEETPQVSITEVPNAKEAQSDEEVDDEIVQMRKSRPQFDVMRGLSVLGITLQTFREVSSKGDKTRLRSLLNEALFVKTKEADKMQAKDPEDSKRQEELSSAHEAFQYMVKTLSQSDTSPRISASTSSGGAEKQEKVQPLQTKAKVLHLIRMMMLIGYPRLDVKEARREVQEEVQGKHFLKRR